MFMVIVLGYSITLLMHLFYLLRPGPQPKRKDVLYS
jgi:hypothetical protein